MRIYYPIPYFLQRVLDGGDVEWRVASTGWGHFDEQIEKWLVEFGHEIAHTPEDADIELVIGQPPFRLKPEVTPSVYYTMYETTKLPDGWATVLNRFTSIVNPSAWGKTSFRQSNVRAPITVIPLGLDTEHFFPIEHPVENFWIYTVQAVQITDRKGVRKVRRVFDEYKMPKDTHLFIKTSPHWLRPEHLVQGMSLTHQITWIQDRLEWDDLRSMFAQCHVSVNPTSGEGFGLIPIEHMGLGMCAMFPYYSGCEMFANTEFNIPLRFHEAPSVHYQQGREAHVDVDNLYEKMIWTYEHQDEALEMGRRSAEWVRENFTFKQTVEKLVAHMEELIDKTDRVIHPYKEGDDLDEWMNRREMFGGLS